MRKKVWYFDNIRLLLTIFVVMWHAANAYIGSGNWPVVEAQTSIIVYGIKTILDAITMPLFFYIAGFFALPSLKKRGAFVFMKAKIATILVPWILVLVFIIPVIEMIGKITRQTLDGGYFDVWIWQMRRMFDVYFGIISGGFYQRYMWFLSVLFTFFVFLGVAYRIRPHWFNTDTSYLLKNLFTKRSLLKLVATVVCVTSVPMLGVILSLMIFADSPEPEPFFSVFNLLQFQSSRFLIYLTYFLLGILTYRNKWIERGLLTHRTVWNIVFAITGIAYFSLTNIMVSFMPAEVFVNFS
ncbi:MAG: acyltransferase family protein [Candidatus Babeliaceae bacterium]|nr:acyltransferase family protein [Candidatus Babeliaceae bacterium]